MNPISRVFRSLGLLPPQRSTPSLAVQPVDPAPKPQALTRRPEGAEFDALQLFALLASPEELKAWDGKSSKDLTDALAQQSEDSETTHVFGNWLQPGKDGTQTIDRLIIARKGPLFTFSHDRLMAEVAVLDPIAPSLIIGWKHDFITKGGFGGCFQNGKAYVTGGHLTHIYGAVAYNEATPEQLSYASSLLDQARQHPCSVMPPQVTPLTDEERTVRLEQNRQSSADLDRRVNEMLAQMQTKRLTP